MQLRSELKQAVDAEAYEKAAQLRDKVHQLEARLGEEHREAKPNLQEHKESE